MTSSQGTEYYLKSMNGIKSFDDGSGTVIEDDTITVATLTSIFISCETFENTGTFYTPAFSANTVNTSFITSALGNLTVSGDITTLTNISAGSIETTGPISAGSLITDTLISPSGILTVSGDINNLSTSSWCRLFRTSTTGNIVIGDGQTTGSLFLGTTPATTGRSGNVVIGATGCNTESRGPLVGNLGVKTTAIDSITPTSDFNFLTNHTSNINIGKVGYDTLIKGNASVINLTMSGILKTAIIQPPPLISQIEFFKDTSLPLYLSKFSIQDRSITTTNTTGDVSLFTNITGAFQIGSIIKIKGVEIYGGAINDTIGLFPTQTGGEIQLGNGLTTGTIALGNSITSGQIKTCGNLIFKASTIASTGINNTISLFNNLTTGTMNFCNSLISGIVNMGGAGTVKVNSKFQVGSSNIQGYTSFINTDTGSPSNYTITTPINSTFTVLVAAQTGQNIIFSAGGSGNSFTLQTNKGAILGCDGSKRVVFAQY